MGFLKLERTQTLLEMAELLLLLFDLRLSPSLACCKPKRA
jgi:hypothetical protein